MLEKLLLLLFASLGFDISSQTPVIKKGFQEKLVVHLTSKRNTDNLKEVKRHFSKKNVPQSLFRLPQFKFQKIDLVLTSQDPFKPLKGFSPRSFSTGTVFKISQKVLIFESKGKIYRLLDLKPSIETKKVLTMQGIENHDSNHDDRTLFSVFYSQLDRSSFVENEIEPVQSDTLNFISIDMDAFSSSETLPFDEEQKFVSHVAQEKVVFSSSPIKNKASIQIPKVETTTHAQNPQLASLLKDEAPTLSIPTFPTTSTNISVSASISEPIANSSTSITSAIMPLNLLPTLTPVLPFTSTINLINTPSPIISGSNTNTQALVTVPTLIDENTQSTSVNNRTTIVSPTPICPLASGNNRSESLISYTSKNNTMAVELLPVVQLSTSPSANETSIQASPSRPSLKRKVTPPLSHFQLSFKSAQHYFYERQAKLVFKEILPDVLRDTLNKPDEILQKDYFEKILNPNMRVEYIYDSQNKLPYRATAAQDFSQKLKQHSTLLDDYMLTQDQEAFEQEILKDPDYSNSYHLIENVRAHHKRTKMSIEPE